MTVNKGSLAYKYISQTFLLLTETVWVLQIVQKRVPISGSFLKVIQLIKNSKLKQNYNFNKITFPHAVNQNCMSK